MTLFRPVAIAAAFFTFAGTVPVDAKVNVIQTSSPALARGSTFAWASMRAIGIGVPDPAVANEITADRLRAVTEAALTSKGYKQLDNPFDADLVLTYTIVMQPETDGRLTSNNAGCRFPLCAGSGDYNLDTSRHAQGTLVLDLIERQSGRLVWRATSKKRVTGKDASEKKLTDLLREMTKSLPLD
jgi:hypothetical protein